MHIRITDHDWVTGDTEFIVNGTGERTGRVYDDETFMVRNGKLLLGDGTPADMLPPTAVTELVEAYNAAAA